MSGAGLILLILSGIAFLEFGFLLFRSMRGRGDETSSRRLRQLATRLKDVRPKGSEASIIRDDREGVPAAFRWLNVRFALRLVSAIDLLLYRSSLSIGTTRFVALSLSVGAFAALAGLEIFFLGDLGSRSLPQGDYNGKSDNLDLPVRWLRWGWGGVTDLFEIFS